MVKFIIPSNRTIGSLASRITQNKKGAGNKALAIYQWICENIEYGESKCILLGVPYRNPFEVLSCKEGNCSEQSLLYISLAASVGLKTKFVKIALGQDQQGLFRTSHSCVTFWDGQQWIFLDFTPPYRNRIGVKHKKYFFLSLREVSKRCAQKREMTFSEYYSNGGYLGVLDLGNKVIQDYVKVASGRVIRKFILPPKVILEEEWRFDSVLPERFIEQSKKGHDEYLESIKRRDDLYFAELLRRCKKEQILKSKKN